MEANESHLSTITRAFARVNESLNKSNEELARLQKALTEYEELQSTLRTLPDRVEHDVMVPLGKLALFPGQLRHTNEVMVHLGDDYFALRSASQAAQIAARRAEALRPQIQAAEVEIETLQQRLKELQYIQLLHEEQHGTVEIREPYEEEDDDEDGEDEDEGEGEDEDEDEDEGFDWRRAGPPPSLMPLDAAAASAAHAPPPPPTTTTTTQQPAAAAQRRRVSFGPAASEHPQREGPWQPPPRSAPAAAAFSGMALGEVVLEREPTAPPSSLQIELREAAAELGALQQRRAAAAGTLGRAGPGVFVGGENGEYPWGCDARAAEPTAAADADPEQPAGGRVSRFKAARMRAREG